LRVWCGLRIRYVAYSLSAELADMADILSVSLKCLFIFHIATKHIKEMGALSADQQVKLSERWNKELNWSRQFKNFPHIVAINFQWLQLESRR